MATIIAREYSTFSVPQLYLECECGEHILKFEGEYETHSIVLSYFGYFELQEEGESVHTAFIMDKELFAEFYRTMALIYQKFTVNSDRDILMGARQFSFIDIEFPYIHLNVTVKEYNKENSTVEFHYTSKDKSIWAVEINRKRFVRFFENLLPLQSFTKIK